MTESIFMIHGMWNGPQYWTNFKDYFDDLGFHCLTPILRFHDMDPTQKPDRRLGTTSVLNYVNDLEQEINTLPEKPIIMGHSMGGLLAQILASREYAKLLVLLTPTPHSGITVLRPSIIWNAIRLKCVTLNKKKPVRPSFKAASKISIKSNANK